MITAPQMTATHKNNTDKRCGNYIRKGKGFSNSAIFIDERNINGDGLDGLASYRHDLRTNERIFWKL